MRGLAERALEAAGEVGLRRERRAGDSGTSRAPTRSRGRSRPWRGAGARRRGSGHGPTLHAAVGAHRRRRRPPGLEYAGASACPCRHAAGPATRTRCRIAGAAGLAYVIASGVENMELLRAPAFGAPAAEIRAAYADGALAAVTLGAGALSLAAYAVFVAGAGRAPPGGARQRIRRDRARRRGAVRRRGARRHRRRSDRRRARALRTRAQLTCGCSPARALPCSSWRLRPACSPGSPAPRAPSPCRSRWRRSRR